MILIVRMKGWLWVSRYRPRLYYAEQWKKGLRDWGYVFWDRPRLEAWGVLDKELRELTKYKFCEWKRGKQVSAEERLLDSTLYVPSTPVQ
ncbi:hypothetical protein VTN77DRAFT_4794 [Rasamsonia byssochlamydoides]|uniref:uncharacterized protein n=1 Tax=Rasamsonia byssochlamydoides TaxID=89139 RepID=UPI003742B976